MRYLPREVDPLVYNMSHEDPGEITYSEIGGLSEQIRELREVCSILHWLCTDGVQSFWQFQIDHVFAGDRTAPFESRIVP